MQIQPHPPETLVLRPPRLGDILIQAGLIDELQLQTALDEQQQWGNRLGVSLVKLGLIDEQELVRALSSKLGVPAVRLEGKKIDPAVLALVPRELSERHVCLPLFTKREVGMEVIYVGMEDPGNLMAIEDLSFRTGMKVRPVIVAPTELWEALDRSYGALVPTPEPTSPPIEPPFEPADTAPVLSPPPPDPGRGADGLLPRSWGPADGASEPEDCEAAEPSAPHAVEDGSPATTVERGRVPTRVILQALTQLLLESELVSRDDLLKRIQAVQDRDE